MEIIRLSVCDLRHNLHGLGVSQLPYSRSGSDARKREVYQIECGRAAKHVAEEPRRAERFEVNSSQTWRTDSQSRLLVLLDDYFCNVRMYATATLI